MGNFRECDHRRGISIGEVRIHKTCSESNDSPFLIIYCFHVSDRGLCLPTVSLWLLFVYVEASVRLRELKNLPFHLDLCRPFAAHW